jgi:hypothetical protein
MIWVIIGFTIFTIVCMGVGMWSYYVGTRPVNKD